MVNHTDFNNKWKVVAVFSTFLLVLTISGIGFFVLGRLSVDDPAPKVEQEYKTPIINGSTPQVEQNNSEKPAPTLRRKPSPTANQEIRKMTLDPIPKLDGYVSSSGSGSSSQDIKIGFSKTATTRGFVAFDISNIPERSEIISATLRLFQIRVDENPFESGENIVIDHLNYGEALDATDFAMPALIYSFSEVSVSRSIGWREIDVTDYVVDDLSNARSSSKFRIHFTNEDTTDDSKEFVYFESTENKRDTGNAPELTVEYI